MKVDPALGIPKGDVTHWAISRVTGWRRNDKQRRVPSYERQTHPRPDGAHLNEWPIDDCTLEIIRERWGEGEFRCHWLINDEEAADPNDRRRSAGNGNIFKLDTAPEPEESVVIPPPAGNAAFMANPDPMRSAFDFAQSLMSLSDQRTQSMLALVQGRPAGDGGSAQVLAEIAGLRAKIEADAAQRVIEERHRSELAERDRKIAELERAKEKAEEEAEKKGDAPAFDPDVSIWEQLPVVAINGVMSLAKTHPEVAMTLMEKAHALWEKRKGATDVSRETPAPTPSPRAAPTLAPRSPVHIVPPSPAPRVVRAVEDDLTPAVTAKAADPPRPVPIALDVPSVLG